MKLTTKKIDGYVVHLTPTWYQVDDVNQIDEGGHGMDEQTTLVQTVDGRDEVDQAVKAERAKGREKLRAVAADLEYYRNKLVHLYNAMSLVTDVFDDSKPETKFSLSTFTPVVREIADELEETKESLFERW